MATRRAAVKNERAAVAPRGSFAPSRQSSSSGSVPPDPSIRTQRARARGSGTPAQAGRRTAGVRDSGPTQFDWLSASQTRLFKAATANRWRPSTPGQRVATPDCDGGGDGREASGRRSSASNPGQQGPRPTRSGCTRLPQAGSTPRHPLCARHQVARISEPTAASGN